MISCANAGGRSVETDFHCPICEWPGPFRRVTEPAIWIGGQYFASLRGKLAVSACQNCSAHITMPRPTPEKLTGFYSLPGYSCHTLEGASKPSLTLNRIANPEYRSWLDFGCGWGALVQAARERGYDARGVEVGDLARASMRQRGLAAYANLSECRAAGFRPDVVSLIHSLEHLADPRELLREIHSTMNPQGSLIVEVPNLKSLRARAGVLFPKNRYPNAQAYYAFPIHLVYYTIDSLRRLLESSGFQIGSTGAHGFGLEIFAVPGKMGETRQQLPPPTPGQPKRLQFVRNATKGMLSRFHLGEHIWVVARPSAAAEEFTTRTSHLQRGPRVT